MKIRKLKRCLPPVALVGVVIAVVAFGQATRSLGGGKPNFDKLSDADRQVMLKRFSKEIWPLLDRPGGRGCVNCHNGRIVSVLEFKGDPKKDFPRLVADGFFLPNDSGSLLSRVSSNDPKRRMPRGAKAVPWTKEEIAVLQAFEADLDRKQKK